MARRARLRTEKRLSRLETVAEDLRPRVEHEFTVTVDELGMVLAVLHEVLGPSLNDFFHARGVDVELELPATAEDCG